MMLARELSGALVVMPGFRIMPPNDVHLHSGEAIEFAHALTGYPCGMGMGVPDPMQESIVAQMIAAARDTQGLPEGCRVFVDGVRVA